MGKVAKSVGNVIGDAVSSVGKAVSKASKGISKSVTRIGSRSIRIGKGLVKSVNKEVIKPVTQKAIDIGKNVVQSPISAVKDLAKGDVVGALSNVYNTMTYGTVDATGGGKSVVNVDTKKELAKVMGVKKQDLGASGTGAVSIPQTYKTGKSGLLQLRQGRGTPGGGSYTETAKNPLGGTAGKTGK